MTRILFVCLGNICRSPAAENILRHLTHELDCAQSFEIDSAGTAGWHKGKSPDSRMSATLTERQVPVTGSARQFSKDDFQAFDLILTMDDDNYSAVTFMDQKGKYSDKVKKFTSFCTEHQHAQVPDPYYGGQEGFNLVADMLEDGCREIIRRYSPIAKDSQE
ncbi:low molecular weight protein-tyrosine-phosphatase [Rubritalea marina]|uniref:low molecular weight protein-tyrosine-phosphatase n=1 Tax=Rubritalea marina TaxID=361055 RepID=UPI00036053EA|nr:low molecular weight protein-tyrosine-phosphatase [Rubritalea marina]